MTDTPRLKEDYILSKCCTPGIGDDITGYYSYNNILKVHRCDCPNLNKAEPERLVKLSWDDILLSETDDTPDDDYTTLDITDFRILEHHARYGVDYSHVVARKLNLSKETAFERHNKLRSMGLLTRVEPRIIQYRKGIVDNKWIKHRNHTYYDLTEKGRRYLQFYQSDSNNKGP